MATNAGYEEDAEALIKAYESFSFQDTHGKHLHLFPSTPSSILEIGAGTGRDARGLADLGHEVWAIEPTAAFRNWAILNHPVKKIHWLDDLLPELDNTHALDRKFNFVLSNAVWMHLNEDQRKASLKSVVRLMKAGARILLSFRYGPVPEGRCMFEVNIDEFVQTAAREGLFLIEKIDQTTNPDKPDILGRSDVSWVRLCLEKENDTDG